MALPATLEDKERIESQIIAALSDDPRLTMRDAAKAVGVSRSNLYRMFDANPAMAECIKQARLIARRCVTEDVEQSLVDRALDPKNLGGVTAGIFLLKGNRPEIYGEKSAAPAGTVINIGALTIIPSQAPAELPEVLRAEADSSVIDLPVNGRAWE